MRPVFGDQGKCGSGLGVRQRILAKAGMLIMANSKQLLTYLRLTNCRLGLVINFGAEMIGDGIARVANGLPSSE
jgi:hypothetical protein